jgi:predicted transcriptional regulator of viral defense system
MIKEVSWSRWFDQRVGRGQSLFSLSEALQETGAQIAAVRVAMHRAMREGRIARVGDGFYVVVTPEYRSQGAPPYEWVVDARFQRLGQPYYLGLLTAAQYHGAGHQKPMEIQVMTHRQMRPFIFGKQKVQPIYRKAWPSDVMLESRLTRTGTFRLSCREWIWVDAVRYPAHAAGFDNIATLIRELGEGIRLRKLALACQQNIETPVLQRLGWLLGQFGRPAWVDIVKHALQGRSLQTVPLETGNESEGPVDPIFRVRINIQPEPDA